MINLELEKELEDAIKRNEILKLELVKNEGALSMLRYLIEKNKGVE